MHVIFATEDSIDKRPEDLKKFLAGWFETIRFMNANKAEAVRIGAGVMHLSPETAGRVYDVSMPMFSETGRFDLKATAILAKSFVELKMLPTEPDMTKLYTEKFLPPLAAK
jgi:ABC-type nitrate/sulfonate/bicarbonate transport system substrate-binding protein